MTDSVWKEARRAIRPQLNWLASRSKIKEKKMIKREGIIQDIKDYVYCKIKIDSIQNMKLRLSKEYFPENIKVGNMITIEYKISNKLIEPVIHVK